MSLGRRLSSSQCSLGAAGRPLQQGGLNGLARAVQDRACWSKIANCRVAVNRVCYVAADGTCAACCQSVGLENAGLQSLCCAGPIHLRLERNAHMAGLHQRGGRCSLWLCEVRKLSQGWETATVVQSLGRVWPGTLNRTSRNDNQTVLRKMLPALLASSSKCSALGKHVHMYTPLQTQTAKTSCQTADLTVKGLRHCWQRSHPSGGKQADCSPGILLLPQGSYIWQSTPVSSLAVLLMSMREAD